MNVETVLITVVIVVVAILGICGIMLYSIKQGFRADLANERLNGELRYQRARGVAQELHRLSGDEDRHIRRMVILLTKGSMTQLTDYIETIPKPEHNELRKPNLEASLLVQHQEKVQKLTEASMDVLGPEGE